MTRSENDRAVTSKPGLSLVQANMMIARLSRQHVDIFSGRENFDLPVEPEMRVETVFPRHALSLMINNENVSHLAVYDLQQQIGPHLVRMGGVAGVGTHADHRFKGYSRRVMVNSLRWMRREGFDVSMLFGIPGFYPKFGFAPVMPIPTMTVSLKDAELARRGRLKFVEFTDDRLRDVLSLYHATHAGRTGIIHRDHRTWVPFRRNKSWGLRTRVLVGVDGRRKAQAYFACDLAQDASVVETGYSSPAVFGDLLRATADVASSARAGSISFRLPPDDAFIAWCRSFGLTQETIYKRDSGGQVRMINIPSTLGKVAPLLASRLAARGSRAGELTIRTNLEDVGLRWSRGKLAVGKPSSAGQWVRLPQWALAQLLYGHRSVDTLLAAGQVTGSKAGLKSLDAMLPPCEHFLCPLDLF